MNKYIVNFLLIICLTESSFSENRTSPGIQVDVPLAIQKSSFKILECLNTGTQLGGAQILDSGDLVKQSGVNYEPIIPKKIIISDESKITRPQDYVITNFVGLSENVWTIKYVMVSTIESLDMVKRYVVLYKVGNVWRIVGIGVPESDLVRYNEDYQHTPGLVPKN